MEKLGREVIDGRPLYRYQSDMEFLSFLEAFINQPRANDEQKIMALAPVAAARFASAYEEGVPSWAHCGTEIERFYGSKQTSQARFRLLMELSLGRYRVPIIKDAGGSDRLLYTIISQAGLPSGMLRKGKVLRGIMDDLMRELARGSDSLLPEAIRLIDEASDQGRLNKLYREAGHLPELCADLAMAVRKLTEQAKWSGGSLDPLWELPNWNRELPFRVEEDAAREIVGELLGVAAAASGGSAMAIDRILSVRDGVWSMKARAVLPCDGIELPGEIRNVLSVQYAIEQEPAGEAFRIRRTQDDKFQQARGVEDLLLGSVNQRVSLVVQDAQGEYQPQRCERGEPLGESATWVFEPCGGEYVYKADAPVRLRAPELLIAAAEGAEITGDAVNTGERISLQGTSRALWRVTGRALVIDADAEPALIHAGYDGPQVYLDFRGKTPTFQTHEFSAVFVGDPAPRASGALFGRIQWRKFGEQEWTNGPARAETGHLSFRLLSSDGKVLAERRRIFVLPADMDVRITNKSVSLKQLNDFEVFGSTPDPDGRYTLDFGQDTSLKTTLKAGNSALDVVFRRAIPTSFVDLATGEEVHVGAKTISSRASDRWLASSVSHQSVDVFRKNDNFAAAFQIGLRGGKLSFSDERFRAFRKALSFHPKGRTHTLVAQFRNGPRLELHEYRIVLREGILTVMGATPEVSIELLPLVPASDGTAHTVQLERLDSERWAIPECLDSTTAYLAVDTTHQAAPCLVRGSKDCQDAELSFHRAIAISEESEREAVLIQLYRQITDDPCDAASSAEIDACLQWLGDFQFELKWLDPFLVLSANPNLALRILILAKLRERVQAEQGLRWALDDVPLFWHRVGLRELSGVLEWTVRHFGVGAQINVAILLGGPDFHIPSRLKQFTSLRDRHPECLMYWQTTVIDWCNASGLGYSPRSPAIGKSAEDVWKAIEGTPLYQSRGRKVPGEGDIFRTYLLAPYELAIMLSTGIEPDITYRNDLLYARHMIDPQQFDDAFCVALAHLENPA
ncbi:MAG: hypothetical protein O9256_00835 [Rhizobiaceae bacterium]|nr:hypothetical protein [Rhizobiaceae bacterium]